MKRFLILVLPFALVVVAGGAVRAQLAPDAGVNDGCCGKICLPAAATCHAPTRRDSRRCQALAYNAGTDAPNFTNSGNGGGGCSQVNHPATSSVLACVGGGGATSFSFAGCECVNGSCAQYGGSSCTQAAVNGCQFGGAAKDTPERPGLSALSSVSGAVLASRPTLTLGHGRRRELHLTTES